MSWSNFEELKKFARNNEIVKKKRLASSVGWHNSSARKRRQTNDESLSFVSNIESTSEIDGFSTDEEKDEELLNCEVDSTSRNLSKPCVKRKYSSKRRIFSDKRSSSLEDAGCYNTYATQTCRKLQDDNSCDLMPDGAYELMQCSMAPKEDEIVSCASDDEELPGIVFYDRAESEDTDSEVKVLTKRPIPNSCQGKSSTNKILNTIKPSGELISDFQSDHESSQESISGLSADISTSTPVCPVVVGTPKTVSEWLKQVQQKSPQKSEQELSPDAKGVGMNCDSAKKKRKFIRSGLAEQLQHVISRDKSEKAFWNHRVTDAEKKQTCPPLQKEGSLVVQILSDQLQGAVHLTQCVLHSDEMNPDPQKTVFVLFNCDTWKQLALQIGALVNIHPPWQKLDIAGCPWPVLLCTYFCEKHQTIADQSVEVLPQSVRAGLFIPFMNTSPSSSSLVQSPRKGFKPSKLLFGDAEDEHKDQKRTALSASLTTVQQDRPVDCKPQASILTAIESRGGFCGALVTFQCMVQRVYCKKAKVSKDKTTNYRCSLLTQDLKSVAKSANKNADEEIRWALLVQDMYGMCAEIQVPQMYQDSHDWHSCLVKGEGKVYTFSHVRVIQRTNRMRSAGLFSLIQSVWCSNGHDTVSCDNGSSQIATQESASQISSITSPANFCYVLALQESSRVSLCQDVRVSCEGFLYKPRVFKTLLDFRHHKDIEPQRISTSCKLLYCRLTGSSADSSFELFITDSSLQNVPESKGRSHDLLRYVKIVGKTWHVLPPELREMQTNCGLILSAKHLLLKVQASNELVADTYSVIRIAVPQFAAVTPSLFHEDTQQDIYDSLTSLEPTSPPSLSLHSSPGYIYLIEGVVTGVDEESACCWLVCDTCENRDISTLTSGENLQFFCSSCNHAVESPQTRTHLAVFVKVRSFPDAQVKVSLQQGTIDKLLPVSYLDNDQGYDIEALLGKQLQPMICYVTECSKQQHEGMATNSFNLEQIQIH